MNMLPSNENTNEMSAGSHGDAVRAAALALYEAGRWVSVDVPREKADAMWATLRDALGLRPGHATARGVDGGGTTPTLTDEEKKALTDAIEEFVEIRDKVSKNSAERYKMLAAYYESVISRLNGLLDRLK